YRAAVGLADAAAERGARLFENSAATKVTFAAKSASVELASGDIRADRVVIATGMPTSLFKALARHFWFRSSYLALTEPVPGRIRRLLGPPSAVIRDSAEPAHVIRWVDDDRLLVAGADGPAPPDRL